MHPTAAWMLRDENAPLAAWFELSETPAQLNVHGPEVDTFAAGREVWGGGIRLVGSSRGVWTPDLAQGIGSLRWFAEMLALIALIGTALVFWPHPDLVARNSQLTSRSSTHEAERSQTNAMRPVPLPQSAILNSAASRRPTTRTYVRLLGGESVRRLLERSGVDADEAGRIASLVHQKVPMAQFEPGWRSSIELAPANDRRGSLRVDVAELRVDRDRLMRITRSAGGFNVNSQTIAKRDADIRIRGVVGATLVDTLRKAGLPESLESQLDLAIVAAGASARPGDHFDIVVSLARRSDGGNVGDRILFVQLERAGRAIGQSLRLPSSGQFVATLSDASEASSTGFRWPVTGRLSSGFGFRQHPLLGFIRMHSGVDIAAPAGTPIYAATDGLVVVARRKGGHGNYVRLSHDPELATAYSHLSLIAVTEGAFVQRGELIGWVGSSGMATGPHLHYEVLRNGTAVNPHDHAVGIGVAPSRVTWRELDAQIASFRALKPLPQFAQHVGQAGQ